MVPLPDLEVLACLALGSVRLSIAHLRPLHRCSWCKEALPPRSRGFPYDALPGFGVGVPPGFGVHLAFYGTPVGYGMPSPSGVVWDQPALANTFHTMSLTPLLTGERYMDTGVNSDMTFDFSNLLSIQPPSLSNPTTIVVGNGSLLPVTSTSHTFFSF
jgi:hypothetical protein